MEGLPDCQADCIDSLAKRRENHAIERWKPRDFKV